MIQLRDYQLDIASKSAALLKEFKIAYLSMEVRTGKTLTALKAAELYGAKCVLVVTKKKAIASIKKDYEALNPKYVMDVINYESLHKVDGNHDLVIVDEAHSLGAFPKPSLRAKQLKAVAYQLPILYLSGTPSPESYSQLYHQFFVSSFSPFKEKNFYLWAKTYVNIKKEMRNGFMVNNYKDADKKMIDAAVGHLFMSYTQQQAGFEHAVQERIISVTMKSTTRLMLARLRKDLVININNKEVLADTPAKLMTKLHQLSSGTIITEDGTPMITDASKAVAIQERFAGQKIAIFYVFQQEKELLKQHFPNWTDSPEVFQESPDKVFLGQFVSAREGIRLDTADALIFYNLQHSFLSYEQARNRLISKDRAKEARLFFVFSDCGIERLIYKAVSNKKNFTLSYYKRNEHNF